MSVSIVMMLWPDSYLDLRSVDFLWFGLGQGIIMLFQNAYQAKRNYVRKTLGKAKQIDVDST